MHLAKLSTSFHFSRDSGLPSCQTPLLLAYLLWEQMNRHVEIQHARSFFSLAFAVAQLESPRTHKIIVRSQQNWQVWTIVKAINQKKNIYTSNMVIYLSGLLSCTLICCIQQTNYYKWCRQFSPHTYSGIILYSWPSDSQKARWGYFFSSLFFPTADTWDSKECNELKQTDE